MPLEKLSWNCPTLRCHWRNSYFCSLHWNTTGGIVTAHTRPAHIVKQRSIHASLKWQDGGTPISKWTGLGKFSLYLEFPALQWIPVLLLTHVSISTSLCACLGYGHHYSFCVFWVASQWNQFSSNNSHHISCILKRLHAGKWPDLMTSKPDSVSTLGYHWTDHTGRPLRARVHWDATGTILADASTQWCCSGDQALICIIKKHWKTIGDTSTLGCHGNHTG